MPQRKFVLEFQPCNYLLLQEPHLHLRQTQWYYFVLLALNCNNKLLTRSWLAYTSLNTRQ